MAETTPHPPGPTARAPHSTPRTHATTDDKRVAIGVGALPYPPVSLGVGHVTGYNFRPILSLMAPGEEKMRVAVMGATGSGKSTFINVASGSSKMAVSDSLESCTIDVDTTTFFLDGQTVTLIDTPGFDDTTRSDTDVLESITDYLSESYSQGARLVGLIYMHRISDNKMGGPSRRNLHMLRNLCGDATLQNVLLVTNMWSKLDPDVGEARERELASNEKFFKPALDRGARMLRHDGAQASAHAILRHLVGLEPATLLVQDEIVNQEKDLAHTTVGADVMRGLNERRERQTKALEVLSLAIEAAKIEKDEETLRVLQEETKLAREEIERVQGDLERMVTNFAAENSRLENENQRYQKAFKKQKADAEQKAQMYEEERRARERAEAGQRRAEAQLAAERESRKREEREQEHERREREKQEYERQEQERQEQEAREQEKREQEKRKHELQLQEIWAQMQQEYERQEREKLQNEKREREERERQEKEKSSSSASFSCFLQ